MFREIDIMIDELRIIGACRIGKMISKDELLHVRRLNIAHDFIKVLKYTSATKALNYFTKQFVELRQARQFIIEWIDYLDMVAILGNNMTSSFIIFPINLKQAHDKMQEEYRNHKRALCNEQIMAISLDLNKKLAYSDKEYLIRLPRDSFEIGNEGSILRHCVDSYIESMAKKQTIILLVRKISEPDKPYYTVEYNNQMVRQCRGFCNANAPAEVTKFLEKWLKEIKHDEIDTITV